MFPCSIQDGANLYSILTLHEHILDFKLAHWLRHFQDKILYLWPSQRNGAHFVSIQFSLISMSLCIVPLYLDRKVEFLTHSMPLWNEADHQNTPWFQIFFFLNALFHVHGERTLFLNYKLLSAHPIHHTKRLDSMQFKLSIHLSWQNHWVKLKWHVKL